VEFQPTPALTKGTLNIVILGFAVVMFALTLLFWPVSAILRKHYEFRLELSQPYRSWRALMRLVCAVNLVFTGLFVAWVASLDSDLAGLSSQFDTRLHLLQALGVVALLGSLLSVLYCLRSWRSESLWLWSKIWNTLLMLACLGFVLFLLNWHMLNFDLRY